MDATSNAFQLLHPAVQRWIYEQGWTELRDAQEKAAGPILDGSLDVIIASATASGKTEAAFLPICSRLLAPENSAGIHLKALARISRLFKNPAFRKAIVDAPDAKAIFELIASEDAKT